jgi:hypothetical protein|tara:strand:- start:118 stop:1572 length:1455 start_codon:yes stop_codon:yes gene_type:complete
MKEPYVSLFNYVDNWKKSIVNGYADSIQSAYGEDLSIFFGPKEERTPIKFLEPEDYQRKLQLIKRANLPKLNVSKGALNLESMGTVDFVTAFKMALDALNAVVDPETGKPVLYGVQLQSYNLDEAVMNGLAVDQSLVAMNMKAQRVIYLWRMFEIAMNFDSSLVFGAKGRYAADEERVFLNDGMQGSMALALHGVKTLIVGFSMKDMPYIDFNQFLACNADVVPITDYDFVKVRNNRARAMLQAGLDVKLEDQPAYNLMRVFDNVNITPVPESATPGAGETKHTAHMQKHFKEFCKDNYSNRFAFEMALKCVRNAWHFSAIDHAPVWGLTELFTQMPKKSVTDDLLIKIGQVMSERWSSSSKVWSDVLKGIRSQYPEKTKSGKYTEWKDHRFTSGSNRGLMIAAAIKSLIDNREQHIQAQPGKQKGYDLVIPTVVKGGSDFTIDVPYVYTDTNGNVAEYSTLIDVDAFNNKAQKQEDDKFAEFM